MRHTNAMPNPNASVFRAGRARRGDDDIRVTVAENVRSLLEHRGWGQNEASRRGYIEQSQISKIVRGIQCPDLETIAKLAATFDVAPFELLVPGLDPARRPRLAA